MRCYQRQEALSEQLKKSKELKPHIAVWWASGAQHAQLMKDGEVDMVIGWNGRFRRCCQGWRKSGVHI
jgi:spermidine/putrescine-binding protein